MAYETRTRTPVVSFGDKFLVANQYVLIKEGPEQVCCRRCWLLLLMVMIIGMGNRPGLDPWILARPGGEKVDDGPW